MNTLTNEYKNWFLQQPVADLKQTAINSIVQQPFGHLQSPCN